jgi:hypothetical protein
MNAPGPGARLRPPAAHRGERRGEPGCGVAWRSWSGGAAAAGAGRCHFNQSANRFFYFWLRCVRRARGVVLSIYYIIKTKSECQ